ncbi:DUF6455 family protein [Rhodosalinus sp. 5P4]|uniref:DUF6455 family protein n=1 Tax=Rhodosalinus sp. 5P4 TaxID=3239196 RepID=UPI00352552EF
MNAIGTPERHFWITRSVARAMGISLSDALAAERLTPQVYARMVENCAACPQARACQEWLGRQSIGHAPTPLTGCRNYGAMIALKA